MKPYSIKYLFFCLGFVALLGGNEAFSQSSEPSTDSDNICAAEIMNAYIPPMDGEGGFWDDFTVGEVCNGENSREETLRPISFKSAPSAATISLRGADFSVAETCITPCWINVDPDQNLDFAITFPSGLTQDIPVAIYEDKLIETGIWLREYDSEVIPLYMALTKDPDHPKKHFGADRILSIRFQKDDKKRNRVFAVTKEDCIYTHDLTPHGVVTAFKFESCGDLATRQAVLDWI